MESEGGASRQSTHLQVNVLLRFRHYDEMRDPQGPSDVDKILQHVPLANLAYPATTIIHIKSRKCGKKNLEIVSIFKLQQKYLEFGGGVGLHDVAEVQN